MRNGIAWHNIQAGFLNFATIEKPAILLNSSAKSRFLKSRLF
ncbi:hypothetical protein [Ancylothrix sp. D3o]|nr:hypothetical protein [Ancylothrix sp. D3o]